MKKKLFRERYNTVNYEELGNVVKTFDEVIKNPPTIEFVKVEPKKRGRKKSVK